MNKEFLTHKEAMALREIGFNEYCIGFYNTQLDVLPIINAPYRVKSKDGAPLYQQAFEWLEKSKKIVHKRFPIYHSKNDIRNGKFEGIIYDLNDVTDKGSKEFNYNDIGYRLEFLDNDQEDVSKLFFKTSRAADKACLKRMIEIVKERKKK